MLGVFGLSLCFLSGLRWLLIALDSVLLINHYHDRREMLAMALDAHGYRVHPSRRFSAGCSQPLEINVLGENLSVAPNELAQ